MTIRAPVRPKPGRLPTSGRLHAAVELIGDDQHTKPNRGTDRHKLPANRDGGIDDMTTCLPSATVELVGHNQSTHRTKCVEIGRATAPQSSAYISLAPTEFVVAKARPLRPPNGLAFSCRERATTSLQKANDLAREAVSCNAGLGGGSQQ